MDLFFRKNLPAFIDGISVACDNNGEIAVNARKHLGIVNDACGVSAVGTADEQKNIGIYPLYLLRVILI